MAEALLRIDSLLVDCDYVVCHDLVDCATIQYWSQKLQINMVNFPRFDPFHAFYCCLKVLHFRIEKRDSRPFYKYVMKHDHNENRFKLSLVVEKCGNASTKLLYQSGSHSAAVDARCLAKLSTEDKLGERFLSWLLLDQSLPLIVNVNRRSQSVMRFSIGPG